MQLAWPILYFAFINLALVVTGFFVVRKKLVTLRWILFIAAITVVYLIFHSDHPVIKMLAIIATTFTGMKLIVAPLEYRNKPINLSFKQWAAFAGGWAGMRAQPFESLGGKALPNAWPMIRFGLSRLLLGGLLILAVRELRVLSIDRHLLDILISAMLLISFSLILHFGMLSISAGIWRLSGANTYLLFRQPATATSLTEFWGKRWNLAFSEMTAIAIFRPLRGRVGPVAALMAAFIFSGLLHELALSLPVNSGYGLPTLYFALHGGLVLFEKFLKERRPHFLENRFVARIWVFFWLVAPSPLLFHIQFIKQIVWPMAGMKFL